MVTPQSLLLHSPLGILGTLAHALGVSFKPPGLGREPWSTTWESSDIAITLTAGSQGSYEYFETPSGFYYDGMYLERYPFFFLKKIYQDCRFCLERIIFSNSVMLENLDSPLNQPI